MMLHDPLDDVPLFLRVCSNAGNSDFFSAAVKCAWCLCARGGRAYTDTNRLATFLQSLGVTTRIKRMSAMCVLRMCAWAACHAQEFQSLAFNLPLVEALACAHGFPFSQMSPAGSWFGMCLVWYYQRNSDMTLHLVLDALSNEPSNNMLKVAAAGLSDHAPRISASLSTRDWVERTGTCRVYAEIMILVPQDQHLRAHLLLMNMRNLIAIGARIRGGDFGTALYQELQSTVGFQRGFDRDHRNYCSVLLNCARQAVRRMRGGNVVDRLRCAWTLYSDGANRLIQSTVYPTRNPSGFSVIQWRPKYPLEPNPDIVDTCPTFSAMGPMVTRNGLRADIVKAACAIDKMSGLEFARANCASDGQWCLHFYYNKAPDCDDQDKALLGKTISQFSRFLVQCTFQISVLPATPPVLAKIDAHGLTTCAVEGSLGSLVRIVVPEEHGDWPGLARNFTAFSTYCYFSNCCMCSGNRGCEADLQEFSCVSGSTFVCARHTPRGQWSD